MSSSPLLALPACLGGSPRFSPPLPMASPRIPDVPTLLVKFERILSSGHLTKGPELEALEKEAAEYLGVRHCVAVSSCTSGLMLVMSALRRKHADLEKARIAVPSYTFMASVAAMVWAGFEPEFVDVDEATMNLCLEDLTEALKDKSVVAALGVHCFGNPVPTAAIEKVCRDAGVPLMFDAAHGFGSLHEGKPVGQAGWCQVYSMTPTKMVVAGEGGVIATDDSDLVREVKMAREYGNDGHYDSAMAGLNARLSELHCAVARESLKQLEDVMLHRGQAACRLQGALSSIPGILFQSITPNSRTTYKDYTIVIDRDTFGCSRDAVAWALQLEGVPSRPYFDPPCHQHSAYRAFSRRPLPRTERLAARCLSIPLLSVETAEPLGETFARIQRHAAEVEAAFEKSREG